VVKPKDRNLLRERKLDKKAGKIGLMARWSSKMGQSKGKKEKGEKIRAGKKI